ncbi:hypothetical protein AAIB48_16635 [Paraclostridium benzoelyticum]
MKNKEISLILTNRNSKKEISKDEILDYIDIIRIRKGNLEWKKLF